MRLRSVCVDRGGGAVKLNHLILHRAARHATVVPSVPIA